MGIGGAEHQLVLQQHAAAALQRAEHTAPSRSALAGVGSVVLRHDVIHLQRPLVLMGAAALAAAPSAG